MKVCLYARMSSLQQEGSLEQQEAALRKHCKAKGYTIAAVYRDEGISGDDTRRRKAFLRMIEEAASGKWERIVCWDQDRFGRFDSIEAGRYVAPLRDAGVSLETLAQGVADWGDFAGRVIYSIAQEGKHEFLVSLARNITRGLVAKASECRGYPGGPPPYGYRRVVELVTQGGRTYRHTRLEVVESEAKVVRRIFADYARPGASANSVARRLAQDGIRSPKGSPTWRRENVARTLTAEAYVGVVLWGRTAKGKYAGRTPEGGVVSRRGKAPLPKAPPIRHHRPDLCPPIVPDELFAEVQRLLKERAKATRPGKTTRPLSGLIKCKLCQKTMHADGRGREGTGNGLPSFRCSSRIVLGRGRPCEGRRVPEALLLEAVQERLAEILGTPKGQAELRRRLERLAAAKPAAADAAAGLRRRLAGLERRLADGADRLMIVPPGLVPELSRALEAIRVERDAVAAELEAAGKETTPAQDSARVVSEMLAGYREICRARSAGEAAIVNAGLRRMGLSIAIDKSEAGMSAEIHLGGLYQAGNSSKPPAVFS